MSEASAGMAVIGEKPGPFSMGPSLYLEYHPKVDQFRLVHKVIVFRKSMRVEAARPLEAEAQRSRNVTLLHSIGQSKSQWQHRLKLIGRAAKNLWPLSSTTRFQHVHHLEENAV